MSFKISVVVSATKESSIKGLHTNTLTYNAVKKVCGVDVPVKKNYLMRTPAPMELNSKHVIDLDEFNQIESDPYDVVNQETGDIKTVKSTSLTPKVFATE